jgi:hypothetical protein
MTYYNGDIQKLLISFYNFLSEIGYDVTMSGEGDDIKVTCDEFASDGNNGTGPWIYRISSYEFCSDINQFIPAIKYTRKLNDSGKEMISHIFKYDGKKIFFHRTKFEDGQWLECLLACMIPSKQTDRIIDKFNSEKEKSEHWYDTDNYVSLSRDIKIKMLLND